MIDFDLSKETPGEFAERIAQSSLEKELLANHLTAEVEQMLKSATQKSKQEEHHK